MHFCNVSACSYFKEAGLAYRMFWIKSIAKKAALLFFLRMALNLIYCWKKHLSLSCWRSMHLCIIAVAISCRSLEILFSSNALHNNPRFCFISTPDIFNCSFVNAFGCKTFETIEYSCNWDVSYKYKTQHDETLVTMTIWQFQSLINYGSIREEQ